MKSRLGGGHVPMGGDHDGLGPRLMLTSELEDLEARGCAFHHQVGHDHIETSMQKLFGRLLETVHDRADVPGFAEGIGHHLGMIMLVLDDQNLGAGCTAGGWRV